MNKWNEIEVEKIIKELESNKNGLSNEEANIKLKRYGKNILPKEKKDNIFKIFINQFINPMTIILFITVILSLIIGEKLDAIFVTFVILLDLIMGTYQEWKASSSANSLKKLIKVKTKVLRDSIEVSIDSTDVVIGDIVLLESGDIVGADIRLINTYNLLVDESILTGESISIYKNNLINKENTLTKSNMVYAGTTILSGRAIGIVVATSVNTEVGKIAKSVMITKKEKSPLTIRVEKFTKDISFIIVIISILITLILFFKGYIMKDIFFLVVALSISAIPEGLSIALTLTLSIASSKMAKKNVIVKKLNAVESLGSCTLIATDKTGTLTLNEQTAKIIMLSNGLEFEVLGSGYNGNGSVVINDKNNIDKIKLISTLGIINNEAYLTYKDNEWYHFGDSIDIAFLSLGYKVDIYKNKDKYKKIDMIPYESENKYSSVLYKDKNKNYITVKGSTEKILEFCSYVEENNKLIKINKEEILKQIEILSSKGYRVIALAYNLFDKELKEENIKDLIFVGLVGFIDPVRNEVTEAINKCKRASLKVVMITGDHPKTAYAIAKSIDIASNYDEVVDGITLEKYMKKGIEEFDNLVKTKKVFSRVSPMQKLEIVESFKRNGEFVAVTGDGVNDAPALKSANIGISLGSGTDVAKDTSSMIIADDNFLSIVHGIEEGRIAYANIRKIIYMLLSCGVSELLFMMLAILFDMPVPLLAVQLLWLNLVTDGIQDVALAYEKKEDNIMNKPPRDSKEPLFNKLLIKEIMISGITIGILVFMMWLYLINIRKIDINIARSYILTLMVFMQNVHVFNCRSEKSSILKNRFKNNPFIVIAIIIILILQVLAIEVDFLSNILGLTYLPILDILYLFLLTIPLVVVMELFKYHTRKKEEIKKLTK